MFYILISFITLHGFPTATILDGISFTTTLPTPIVTLSPIVTPGKTVIFPPIHTLFPTFIGFAYSSPLFHLNTSYVTVKLLEKRVRKNG